MPTLTEGQKFERCRIHRYLGEGSSGESYEAEDVVLQRKVTLKLIHPWSPLPEAARRQFFREMQDICVLEHTYLAAMLDFGEYNGQLFIARRYIGPGSLLGSEGRYWYRPPLAVSTAIHYTHQLAQALQAVHMRGYAHGSLTMANIQVLRGPQQYLEDPGAPFLITDVGLASFIRRFGKPQTTLLPVTTAPEQLGGRTTPASDQYALAIILYFWLTGILPFMGSPDAIEQQKLSESFASPATLNSHITTEQAHIIKQALSVYPEDRYPSILAFSSALQTTLTSTSSRGKPFASPQTAPPAPTPFSVDLPKTPAPFSIESIPSIPNTPLPLTPANLELEFPHIQQFPSTQPGTISSSTSTDQPGRRPLDHVEELLSALVDSSSSTMPPAKSYLQEMISTTDSVTGQPAQAAEAQAKEPAQTSAYLVITSRNTRTPLEIKLVSDKITIGRAGSSDILLDQDTLTSRHQALLKHEMNHYVLYDLRSAYGTTVNGKQLRAEEGHILHDGDKIVIGSYELVFTTK